MKRTVLTSCLAAIAVMCFVNRPAARAAHATLAVEGRTNSTPWVATDRGFVAVVWGAGAKGAADVFVAVSSDGGKTFGSPRRVNAVTGSARISGEIAPRVALHARGGSSPPEIVVAWNAKERDTAIQISRSRDGGKTFDPPSTLQSPGVAGDRGWQALTLDAKGAAHAIWLDHRGMATGGSKDHSAHKGEHDGVAMAQKSGLYYASSRGASGNERELFKGVCYCCKTAITTGPDGTLYAAWRHVFAGNFRDIAFTSSRDGGKSFAAMTRVNQDGWSINGCPDDGPAMAVEASGVVHLVWPTVLNGAEGAILHAVSRDGRTFAAAVRIPTMGAPKPSHPQIAIDGTGRIFVAWDEAMSGVRRAAIRQITPNRSAGLSFGDIQMLGEDGPSLYPVLAPLSTGVIAVWTSGPPDRSTIAVRSIQ